MLKNPKVTWKSQLSAKFLGRFSPIVPPSAAGFASVASDAGGLLWRMLERSKSLVLLQVGSLTCRWQRHSVKPSCWECSTTVEQAETKQELQWRLKKYVRRKHCFSCEVECLLILFGWISTLEVTKILPHPRERSALTCNGYVLHSSNKRKAVPLQARCGPEGSRRFKLPDFHDIRHVKVVKLSASRTSHLYPQKCSWYSFSPGAESNPGPGYGRKEICHWKIQWHHRESIPGPSDW
jgi:hypothetical protein